MKGHARRHIFQTRAAKAKTHRLAVLLIALFLLVAVMGTPGMHGRDDVQLASQRLSLDNALRELGQARAKKLEDNVGNGAVPGNSPERQAASMLPGNTEEPELPGISNELPQAGLSFQTSPFPFVHPVMGPRKSSGFGFRVHPVRGFSSKHKGVDLAAPIGASIRAVSSGRVVFADPYAGYGRLVVIDHGRGITTHYAHCDKLSVRPGQLVTGGQIIAEVGSTGMSTGPHLHLEIRIAGVPVNPEEFFPGLAESPQG